MGRFARALLLGGLFALAALPVAAIDSKPLNTYFRETWTTREGLPHNQVHAIAQTPDGYLWFATWEGLVRYNGLEFQVFNRGNQPALDDNGIRSVSVAPDGALLVGTSRGGLTIYRDGRWSRLSSREGLAQDEVMAAIEDRAGRLWVATESAGLTRVAPGVPVRQFRIEDGLPSNNTYGLLEDRDGALWVSTAGGLARIADERIEAFGPAQGLPAPVFNLVLANDGRLLIGTEHGVFVRENGGFRRYSPDLPDDAVPSLRMDAAGQLWVGTVGHGLLRVGSDGVEQYSSLRGLPNNRVAALFIDREGSLWIGTNAGLMRFRDAPFSTLNSEHGFSDDYVRALVEARDGAIWVGTSRGLNRWQDGAVSVLTQADGLPGDSILSLLEDQQGGLWIGTYATGVMRWHDGAVRQHLSSEDGLPGNQVRALAEAADGTLWIGTARGLARYRDGQLRRYGVEDGLPREFILGLHMGRDGALWVGTANGAAVLRDDRITSLDLSAFDQAQDVFGFLEEADGTIWIATDRGLVRHRAGALAHVGLKHGLPIDTVFQAVADHHGYFWLTSNRGVMRIAHDQVEAAADGVIERIEVELFGEGDGMASAQCNGGSGPVALRAQDGSLWIATAKGAAVIQPQRLALYRRTPPPVVIEQVLVDDRPVDDGPAEPRSHLVLPAGTRKLEVHYAGLSFQMPRLIRYRYRLEGFDPDWVDRGHQRSAQYTNLPPGEYRFQVTAANPGGGWSPEPAVIEFEIEPRLWQRTWFVAGAMLLVLLALYGLFRWRVYQLEARQKTLRDMVDQRTRDLRAQTGRLLQADREKTALLEQLREQSEAFERQAREDALTGIANRRSMDERLARAFELATRDKQPLSFALVDIDHFKRINDQYSHAAGDAALRAVARRMGAELRRGDILARWGGEEFAILFPGTPVDEARGLCERLRAAVETMDCSEFAPGLRMTVSAGITDRTGLSHHERLVSRADTRLYEAKHAGRNCVRS